MDNTVILMMTSIALKDLANELNIFMMSGTQLNDKWKEWKGIRDYNLIRGSKAICDKIDVGGISLPINQEEEEIIKTIVNSKGCGMPTQVQDIYKVRRGKYNRIKIWSRVDLGTCRTEDLFLTDQNNVEIPIIINETLFRDEMGSIINQKNLVSDRKEETQEIKELKERTVEKELTWADLI